MHWTPIEQSQKVRLPCPFKHAQYTAFPWVMERDKSDPIQSSPIKVEDKLWWEVMSVCRELIPLSLRWGMAHSSSVPSRTQTLQALIWMSVSDLFLDSSYLSGPNFFDLRCCTSKILLWQIQRIQHYKTFPAAELSRSGFNHVSAHNTSGSNHSRCILGVRAEVTGLWNADRPEKLTDQELLEISVLESHWSCQRHHKTRSRLWSSGDGSRGGTTGNFNHREMIKPAEAHTLMPSAVQHRKAMRSYYKPSDGMQWGPNVWDQEIN